MAQRTLADPDDADARAREDNARACLNHLVADAMTLAPSCLRYMARLRHPDVFRFCAIPQLMAIATLDKLVNNADVFTGVVKIRKGQALKLMAGSASMSNVYSAFLKHSRSILAAIPPQHKSAYALAARAAAEVEAICLAALPNRAAALATSALVSPQAVVAVLVLFAWLLRYLHVRSREASWGHGNTTFLPRITDSWDVAALSGVVACVMYLLAMAGVPIVLRLTGGSGNGSPNSPTHAAGAPAGAAAGTSAASGGAAASKRKARPATVNDDGDDDSAAVPPVVLPVPRASTASAGLRQRRE